MQLIAFSDVGAQLDQDLATGPRAETQALQCRLATTNPHWRVGPQTSRLCEGDATKVGKWGWGAAGLAERFNAHGPSLHHRTAKAERLQQSARTAAARPASVLPPMQHCQPFLRGVRLPGGKGLWVLQNRVQQSQCGGGGAGRTPAGNPC
mmetsp:Transcript_23363/g.88648  ORF Transcript_23363/g.88648 Transcript_23363/m.88648 type:complete len:150 (+) Transcript_23363:488-937(+)